MTTMGSIHVGGREGAKKSYPKEGGWRKKGHTVGLRGPGPEPGIYHVAMDRVGQPLNTMCDMFWG